MAAAVTLAIRVAGSGGHGSAPHKAVDPVVTAAYIVTRLQSIVSREVDPADPAVVTVGMLQAGTAGNVIPDEARMAVNVRSYDDDVQRHLLEAIDRVVKAEALAGRSPAEPEITTISHTRVTSNDAGSMQRVRSAHEAYFGTDRVVELPRLMGSEDFGEFGLPSEGDGETEIPCVFWGVGCTDAETWRRGHVAFNHSPFFRVERVPTLRTALEGMTVAALAFLAG